jgi:hypothetical protein
MRNRLIQTAASSSILLSRFQNKTKTSTISSRLAAVHRHFFVSAMAAPQNTTSRLAQLRKLMKEKHVDIYGNMVIHHH